jgi:hypothetical protein
LRTDTLNLNAFSKQVYEFLKEQYPQWLVHTSETDHERGAFELRVASPSGEDLEICTCNDEVSVSYGLYHEHDTIEQARNFIASLVAGRTLVASVYQGDEWVGSRTIDSADLEQFLNNLKRLNRKAQINAWNPSKT